MSVLIRFSDAPEDLIFEVCSRTEYAEAVRRVWGYVRSGVTGLKCFVECPDSLSEEWARVPNLIVPTYSENVVALYRQWPKVLECADRVTALAEIVEGSRSIGGAFESDEVDGRGSAGVVVPIFGSFK